LKQQILYAFLVAALARGVMIGSELGGVVRSEIGGGVGVEVDLTRLKLKLDLASEINGTSYTRWCAASWTGELT